MEDHLQFLNRDVLFEFHLKFWNTACIGIPVRSLLQGGLTCLTAQQKGTTARWYSNKTSLRSQHREKLINKIRTTFVV